MTPTLPTFLATAAFGALCWLAGVAAGRRQGARERYRLIRKAAWLQLQVVEALRIIERQDQANLAAADRPDPFRGQWRADPSAWAAFQEGRERPETN
jgi:hypothetical protein